MYGLNPKVKGTVILHCISWESKLLEEVTCHPLQEDSYTKMEKTSINKLSGFISKECSGNYKNNQAGLSLSRTPLRSQSETALVVEK